MARRERMSNTIRPGQARAQAQARNHGQPTGKSQHIRSAPLSSVQIPSTCACFTAEPRSPDSSYLIATSYPLHTAPWVSFKALERRAEKACKVLESQHNRASCLLHACFFSARSLARAKQRERSIIYHIASASVQDTANRIWPTASRTCLTWAVVGLRSGTAAHLRRLGETGLTGLSCVLTSGTCKEEREISLLVWLFAPWGWLEMVGDLPSWASTPHSPSSRSPLIRGNPTSFQRLGS